MNPFQKSPATEVFNLNEIRKQAQQGAVTPNYPLDSARAVELLNGALATEIVCVLRYRHHQIVAKGINFPQVAAEFEEHADQEEEHLMMLAERINQLGGDPDLNPNTVSARAAAQYGTVGSLQHMIREDLIEERVAIEVYRNLIAWFGEGDPTTRRLLERILEQEEEHADDLANLLDTVESQPRARAMA